MMPTNPPTPKPSRPGFGVYPRRTVYVLKDAEGHCLLELKPGFGPSFTPDPVTALKHRMAWLTQEVAIARLRAYSASSKKCPPLTVSPVEMQLTSLGWQVAQ
jgi:hypothetical protein